MNPPIVDSRPRVNPGPPAFARLRRQLRQSLLLLIATGFASTASAFPPAPHHLIHGLVRDELGNPLQADDAEIVFEAASGTRLRARIAPGPEPGRNYQLAVPMDSGLTADLYMPTALKPTMPFRIRVRIGQTLFLPIEMSGDYRSLGEPGKQTLLNLTLGEDMDQDGLPDAWERSLIAGANLNQSLANIRPGDDTDGDGLSNLDEYLTGTYAFDRADGYELRISKMRGSEATLEFMAIRGRTYSIHSSRDLLVWTPVAFKLSDEPDGSSSPPLLYHQADNTRITRVTVVTSGDQLSGEFFKLLIQ